jgi:glycosyltransferase involved in cell wall biosynthesis
MKKISIIVPVFNAQQYIKPCLNALVSLNYPKDSLEIIVVDNGSKDKTIEIVKQYDVQLFILPKCTISALRNFAAKQAKGDLFAFIDADCIAPANWLNQAEGFLKDPNIGAVGCWYALPATTTLVERAWDIHTMARREKKGDIDWIPSGNLIIPKEVYQQINGFDENLITSEDVDVCQRIHEFGLSVYSDPQLAVVHLGNPKTLRVFFLKEKWRGEGVIQNLFRELPHPKLNKAILFTLISLVCLIGIIDGLIQAVLSQSFIVLFYSSAIILLIPCYLSLKAVASTKKWLYFFPLVFLFLVYAVSRILSILNPKVWKSFPRK